MHRNRGFTLIEIMVVVAIMAGMITLALPYITNRNAQTKAILRELIVLSRELHTRAKLQGAVYRLVIDLQEDSDGKRGVQSFWVERANGNSVIKVSDEAEAMARLKDKDLKPDPRAFEIDKTILKKPKQLPSGMTFEKVELSRVPEAITHGRAFINYMPQGLTDEAAIHIKGEKKASWTISIQPLTGRAELVSKTINLQELKSQ